MRRLASTLLLITACASGHYKTEHVGSGIAFVSPRGAVPATSPGVPLPAGEYDLHLRFDLPRAQLVEWSVTCPGATSAGSVGESFDAYRRRRLAELAADRDRAASVTGAVVGAFAPTVQVQSPNASAQVSGQAVGAAAGTAVAGSMPVELPPGDVGAGRVQTTVHVATTAAGACAVTAVADDANVIGGFEIVHVRDLDAEARARIEAQNQAARAARDRLATQLEAFGADPALRQKQRDAEAQARAAAEARAGAEARMRAEAELRVHAEIEARADADARARADADARARAEAEAHAEAHRREVISIEVRQREVALDARARYRALLISWGADVTLRQRRLEAEAHARAEAEARAGAELRARAELRVRVEVQARAEAELRARAELALRIRTAAYDARARYRALLIIWGADPDYRAHLEARAREERERHAAELRVQVELRETREREERERIDAQLAAAEEERHRTEARRLEVAMTARAELRAYLVAIGARERPPMPAPRFENPGPTPFAGASWSAGHWTWTGGEWAWNAGGWRDTSVTFGAAGGEAPVAADAPTPVLVDPAPVPVVVETITPTQPSVTIETVLPVRDHRTVVVTPPTRPTPPVRDHRTEPPRRDDPKVRDHRR